MQSPPSENKTIPERPAPPAVKPLIWELRATPEFVWTSDARTMIGETGAPEALSYRIECAAKKITVWANNEVLQEINFAACRDPAQIEKLINQKVSEYMNFCQRHWANRQPGQLIFVPVRENLYEYQEPYLLRATLTAAKQYELVQTFGLWAGYKVTLTTTGLNYEYISQDADGELVRERCNLAHAGFTIKGPPRPSGWRSMFTLGKHHE